MCPGRVGLYRVGLGLGGAPVALPFEGRGDAGAVPVVGDAAGVVWVGPVAPVAVGVDGDADPGGR